MKIMKCDLCGKEYPSVLLRATSFTDYYCKPCLRLVIAEAEIAIEEIEIEELVNNLANYYAEQEKDAE